MSQLIERSPRSNARFAGGFYVFSVLIAIAGESIFHGKLAIIAGLFAVACFAVVTLLMLAILKPVNRTLALLATLFGLAGLTFEALRWGPFGIDMGVVLHGLYCVLIGCIVLQSTFLPRILGALMVLAGLAWLVRISPHFAHRVYSYSVAVGFVGEGLLMLWLLVMAVDVRKWKEQTREVTGEPN
jgi:hypothetical protein